LNRYWLAVLAGPLSIALACFVFTRLSRGGLNQEDSPVTFAATGSAMQSRSD